MTGVDSYSTTPATNATATGGSVNWSEGQAASTVNNSARQVIADLRAAFNDLIWLQYGTGDQGAGNIAVPSVYASGTSFTITGADVTAVYHTDRRVRAVGSGTGTINGSISSSSYNGGNTTTTVNVTWDSGSLSNETLVVSLSQIPATGKPSSLTAIKGGTFSTDLLFTDATYDIGKSGATRPRDGFFSRNLSAGGTLAVTSTAAASQFKGPSSSTNTTSVTQNVATTLVNATGFADGLYLLRFGFGSGVGGAGLFVVHGGALAGAFTILATSTNTSVLSISGQNVQMTSNASTTNWTWAWTPLQ